MVVAAFVLSIIAVVLLLALVVVFIWFGAMVNKQEATREFIEQKHKQESKIRNITIKGIAAIAAAESGLMPRIEGGWDDTAFNKFWEAFERAYMETTGKSLE